MDAELRDLAMELGTWPKNAEQSKGLLQGSGWFYMPKTGAVKSNRSRRVVLKPEWLAERQRLEKLSNTRYLRQ